jgi:hypothetical protein
VRAEEDEVGSPFQRCIQLASVPVVRVFFPTSERWQDVAGCLRGVPCGEPGAHELKGLQPFSSVYVSLGGKENAEQGTGREIRAEALSLMARLYT